MNKGNYDKLNFFYLNNSKLDKVDVKTTDLSQIKVSHNTKDMDKIDEAFAELER